jgi:putative endonuclease
MIPGKREWSVYLIETRNGKWYAGITKDPERRFREHSNSIKKGAKFFRTSAPKSILFQMKGFTRSEALRIEFRIKSMSRAEKAALIGNPDRKQLRTWLRKPARTRKESTA